jgi:release factor glutamine methyltransferase
LPNLRPLLRSDGVAILEVGAGQAKSVAELAREAGFSTIFRQDLSGIVRTLVLQSPPT